MIGQKQLRWQISEQIGRDVFPKFAIISGSVGQGKKTLARLIAKQQKIPHYILEDVKVDTIRKMISDSYKVRERICYIIPDADRMSLAAKNSLLKVTEEPPNKSSFILTVSDESTLLNTIKSRGTIYRMHNYSKEDLQEYIGDLRDDFMLAVCENMHEIDLMRRRSSEEYYEQAHKILDKIADISIANALKSRQMIAFKEDDDGLDFRLLLKSFQYIVMNKYIKNDEPNDFDYIAELILTTNRAFMNFRVSALNKQSIYDMWIFDLRKVIHKYEERQ